MELLNRWLKKNAARTSLRRVMPLELAVVNAYDHAIGRIAMPGLADQLAQFRNEHLAQLEALAAEVASIARALPKGLLREVGTTHPGWDGILVNDDSEAAIEEVLAAERRCDIAWGRIRTRLPSNMHALVQRFRSDEVRHIRFLEKMLAARVWDRYLTPVAEGENM